MKLGSRLSAFYQLVTLSGFLNAVRFAITKELICCKVPGSGESVYIRGRSSDYATLRQVFIGRHYEYPGLPEKPKIIVDLGANIGLSAIYFRNRFPDAEIYTFEPSSDNFSLLQKNTVSCSKTTSFHIAITSKDGKVSLVNPGAHQDSYRFSDAKAGKDLVDSWSMNTLMRELQLHKIDILKIDIEGAEVDLFSDVEGWLERVDYILVEVHEQRDRRVENLIRQRAMEYGFVAENFGEGLALTRMNELQPRG